MSDVDMGCIQQLRTHIRPSRGGLDLSIVWDPVCGVSSSGVDDVGWTPNPWFRR